ncbi:alpha/beta hydrolase [Paraburkholderia sp. J63]|uniref:alpha/beta hydrolase n=1 Tax=Paraburkholderia sp. J63 TaxID=2805434 RepID=UPI002ABD9F98|nr:alpha/beta hydrolase [Paraburkholderia sp. J63]
MSAALHIAWVGLLVFAAAALLVYVAATGLLFWLQGRLIYPPERMRRGPTAHEAAQNRIGYIRVRAADGIELVCGYAAPRHAERATVVLFHGNGDDLHQRMHVAHALLDAGYGVLLAGYRGYGGAPGHPHEAGLYADGRAALAYAMERSRRVVVHGYSLGSGVAVQLATEFALAALILEAPFTSIADVAATRFRWMPVRRLVRDRYDNLAKIGRVAAPVLIYGGNADRVIPPAQFSRLYTAVRAPRRLALVADASHVDAWERGGATHVLRFLADVLTPGPRESSADSFT